MRILLDSRDLINLVEHGRPITSLDFDAYLRAGDHQIVLTFTNVKELAGPLAVDGDFLRVRDYLQSLEQMPHTYLKEAMILAAEIQSAVNAFNGGTEYECCSPYVTRWDYTLGIGLGQQRSPVENVVGLRLDEIVYFVNRTRPDIFAPPPPSHLKALREQFQRDRAAHRAGQAPGRQHFIGSVTRHAERHDIQLPCRREVQFAEWGYENPNRCPGLRLHHETYRALVTDYGNKPQRGDFFDLAHVPAIPYVNAVTMDRRMRHYCVTASRKMLTSGAANNYADRLYQDVAALMQAHT